MKLTILVCALLLLLSVPMAQKQSGDVDDGGGSEKFPSYSTPLKDRECRGVAATGQTDCWDSVAGHPEINCVGTGQDGEYEHGVTTGPYPRFTDNLDGTVTDNLTGLIWLQQQNCFGWRIWTDALTEANTLADGSCGLTDGSLPGDWRLPNIRELISLIDYGQKVAPAFPVDHPFPGLSSGTYWSSTNNAEYEYFAWYMNFNFGGIYADHKTFTQRVWPVRGPGRQGYPTYSTPLLDRTCRGVHATGQKVMYSLYDDGDYQIGLTTGRYPRFTDHGDGTVADNLTGLIWLQNASCTGQRNWTDALSDANGLADGSCRLADGSLPGDWRLPNIRELESLIDYGETNPALPPGHPFSGVQEEYWSSTSNAQYGYFAWKVRPGVAGIYRKNKKHTYHVWPVRGGQ